MVVLINVQIVHYDTVKVQVVDTTPNLVLFGDSITAIKGVSNSYSDILTKWWNEIDIEVINEGIGGSCICDANVAERITIHHPKYLLIEYGLNDIRSYGNSTQFYNNYNRILDEIIEQNPRITVFLSTITWAKWYYFPEQCQVEYKDKIVQISTERNLTLANLWDVFYRNNLLTYDGVHQNDVGALVIVNIFNNTFYNLINNSPFGYVDDIQVPHEYHMNLNLNIQQNEYQKEIGIDFVFLQFILSISLVLAVIICLFEERKRIEAIACRGE